MEGWSKIESVPRDGSLVWLCWYDEGPQDICLMQWGHIQQNNLFPGKVGMWVSPSGGFTWNEELGGGPDYWKPYVKGEKP